MVYRQEERERSKPLHNFPIIGLKWGTRVILECRKVNSNEEPIPSSSGDRNLVMERQLSGIRVEPEFERYGSIDRVKASVGRLNSSDLHTKADRMNGILREGLEKEEGGEMPQSPPTDGGAMKPWNLRTRRAASNKEPMNGVNGERSLNVDVWGKPNNLSSRLPSNSGGDASIGEKKRKRAKFSVSLSRSEIEQDFIAMTGHRLPRRPNPNKKRPRAVRKILENLSPAMWLTEVHPSHYKVPNVPDNGKFKYFE